MGYYTSLRARMTVKPKYRKLIQMRHDRQNPDGTWKADWGWEKVLKAYPTCDALRHWVGYWRADFIPNGALGNVPPDFSKTGDTYSEFDPETGVWEFACSLKNYEGEIEAFVSLIVADMIESIEYCESIGENWRDWLDSPHPWDTEETKPTKTWQDFTTKYTLPVEETKPS